MFNNKKEKFKKEILEYYKEIYSLSQKLIVDAYNNRSENEDYALGYIDGLERMNEQFNYFDNGFYDFLDKLL